MTAADRSLQPLVLVPGLLCDPLMWAPQVAGLADVADCWVAGNTAHDSIEDIAAEALDACPFDHFALAGLSMGGYIAQEMWRQASERVLRLALLDTNAIADPAEASANRRGLMARAEGDEHLGEGLPAVVDALLPRLVWPRAADHLALGATLHTMARNTGVAAFLRQQTAIMGRRDQRGALPGVACPALVLCGEDDMLTPPALHREMAALIPGAVLEVLPQCGHMSPLEQPDAVNRALRAWLARS